MSGPDLSRFLIEQASAGAGEANGCGLLLARWYDARKGRMPASGLLTRPDAETGVGVFRAVCRVAKAEGLQRTDVPRRGDVGLVRAGNAMLAAICTGDRWAAKGSHGILILRDATLVRAWRLP